MSVINISKNHVKYSRTKHIDIRHYFIRDLVEDKVVNLGNITTDQQIVLLSSFDSKKLVLSFFFQICVLVKMS